ncbi:GNAT family N-acetyltransferase [Mastigocoleus testarum]|uniref:GCN5 family acetyltransferase n=1 Tax=Mastigocoleus testarum BC008 TaxID=371196 RepID=A0A0V7ZFG3_9CYAN|nr:GNAT family N-acetyltransferase [Mastigocoleus testarum]KST63338.1 GCN5 family acetyltransferase [Mastigocoleus testarum BC008]
MTESRIQYTETRNFCIDSILNLYKANEWSAAEKPQQLYDGLMNSHYLVSAWDDDLLVGLGNAITDGYLVVYYPHLLVLPAYQKKGIGYNLLQRLTSKYKNFHQRILVADNGAVGFYKKCGFERAGKTQPMWIYQGK